MTTMADNTSLKSTVDNISIRMELIEKRLSSMEADIAKLREGGGGTKSGGNYGTVTIQVQYPEGQIISLDVHLSDTVLDVRNLLQIKTQTSTSGLTFVFEDKILEEQSTLEACGVKRWSTLHIQGIEISVKIFENHTIPLHVSPKISIHEIKRQILKKTNIPMEGFLLCNGQQLLDEGQLSDYSIKSGDVLQFPSSLTVDERAASMKIGMRVRRGRDWEKGDNSDGDGKGTVVREAFVPEGCRGGEWKVGVRWDNGREGYYLMYSYGGYHLQLA